MHYSIREIMSVSTFPMATTSPSCLYFYLSSSQ